MRMSRAFLVMRKEWRELRSNKLLLVSMASLPVILTLVPIAVVAIGLREADDVNAAHLVDQFGALATQLDAANGKQLVVRVIVSNWMGMFLMLPVFVPIVVSAQAIVGEKERRTIEPLLAAPIHVSELLLGKTLAALLPGVFITWASFAVFATCVDVLAFPFFGRLVVPDLAWGVAMVLIAPLLALLGNGLSVIISSRVNDARLAQQLAGTAVLPLVGLFVLQMARGLVLGASFYLAAAGVLALVDLALYYAAIRLFDRERILTSLR